jgi:peptidoglycan biosynthesis protein MviN/MurJ (putative lipid II flippase)
VFRLAALGVALTIPVFGVVLWLAGLMPAIAAWIGCGVVMLFVGAKWLLDDLRQSMKPLLSALIRPVIASIAMAASLLAVQAMFPTAEQWTIGLLFLLGLVAFGAIVYAAALTCLWLLAGRPHEGESELLFLAMSRMRKP